MHTVTGSTNGTTTIANMKSTMGSFICEALCSEINMELEALYKQLEIVMVMPAGPGNPSAAPGPQSPLVSSLSHILQKIRQLKDGVNL